MAVTQNDLDKVLSHTIRIELKDGSTLIYYVTAGVKNAFRQQLLNDAVAPFSAEFLWFYLPAGRLVLINKIEIIRITFLFDILAESGVEYFDNFDRLVKDHELSEEDLEKMDPEEAAIYREEPTLPQLIIMHGRKLEDTELVKGVTMKTEGYFGNISACSSLTEGDLEGLAIEYDQTSGGWMVRTYQYLQFIDDDGEENFMPLINISVIEVERGLIMNDELLALYLNDEIS
jgi:hypothetical protein